MPDAAPQTPLARSWGETFAALPAESPPADGWARVSARLEARPRRHRRSLWLATAAALLLAVALPWKLQQTPDAAEVPASADSTLEFAATPAPDPLQALYAESGQLEALLRLTRDDRVASGTAAAMASDLDARIASIDAALMQSGLSPAQQHALWQARVDTLRTAAGFAGTRRWLVAHGARYDARLIQVD